MKQLLLIDDDPSFASTLARVLARHDYRVTTAPDATTALGALEDSVPDAAVVDLKLGRDSGLDLIAPLRAANAGMRIVLLTGYASIATTVDAIKRGADNYLAKPLDIDALLAALADDARDEGPARPMSLRRLEWEHIQRVLDEHDGNVSAAARALGVHRRTLQRKLARKPVRR